MKLFYSIHSELMQINYYAPNVLHCLIKTKKSEKSV